VEELVGAMTGALSQEDAA